jgi:uncharacterized membrane protein YjgN (DUF898 family)
MALLSKDPRQLRKGAWILLTAVPFLYYAAFFRRAEPLILAVGFVLASSLLIFCLWVLRRAARMER